MDLFSPTAMSNPSSTGGRDISSIARIYMQAISCPKDGPNHGSHRRNRCSHPGAWVLARHTAMPRWYEGVTLHDLGRTTQEPRLAEDGRDGGYSLDIGAQNPLFRSTEPFVFAISSRTAAEQQYPQEAMCNAPIDSNAASDAPPPYADPALPNHSHSSTTFGFMVRIPGVSRSC